METATRPSSPERQLSVPDAEKIRSRLTANQTTAPTEGTIVHVEQPFSTLTAIGIGYGTTNSACGVLSIVASATAMGGSPLFFWGYIAMALVGLAVAVSLGELASMYPHPGGQYYWVARLAPGNSSSRRFLTYFTAIFSWAGAVCTTASAAQAVVTIGLELYGLSRPDFVAQPWLRFIFYVLAVSGAFWFNLVERFLPPIGRFLLFFAIATMAIIFISIWARSSEHVSAEDFFLLINNETGWPSGFAFVLGLNSVNWCFTCLDCATHLAEEIPEPAKNIPKILLWTVGIGFSAGMAIILALYINSPIQDATSALSIFYNVFEGNAAAALGLHALPLISLFGSIIGSQTWQSRLAWSFARDGGFPFHKYLRRLAPHPFRTPIWAHLWSVGFNILLGLISLASTTALNAFISAAILFQYISYSIPIGFLLWRGRDAVPHGPFWGGRWGLVANIVTLVWTAFGLVVYSFPYSVPVFADEMNYTSVVLAGLSLYIFIYWFVAGRHRFTLPPDDMSYS